MSELKLTIELVPSTAWGSNVRAVLTNRQWNALSGMIRDRAWGICEICGNESSDCHEIWHYNERTYIRKLTGLISLCQDCHMVKHYGLATVKGREEKALLHFMKVNKLKRKEAEEYVEQAFETWRDRSKKKWTLDLSSLKQYGVDVGNLKKEDK